MIFFKLKTFLFVLLVFLFSASLSFAELTLRSVITGDAFSGNFKGTDSIYYDEENERLYISDSLNNRFVSFDSGLEFLSEFPSKNLVLTNEVRLPLSFVKSSKGDFYYVDGEASKLMKVTFKANEEGLLEVDVVDFKIKGLPSAVKYFIPGRISLDKEDNLYVADKINKKIFVFDIDGNYLRTIGARLKGFYGCKDLKVNEKGDIYCIDLVGKKVYLFNKKGKVKASFANNFKFPVSIAFDSRGRIYVLDKHKANIGIYTTNGTLLQTIGRYGFRDGEFFYPTYIYIDSEDRLFALDGVRIQVFKEGK